MKVGIIIIMAACHTAMAAEQSWRAGMIVGTPGIRQFQEPSRCESAAAEPGGPLYAMPAVSFTYVLRCMCMCLHKNGYSPEQENIITMLSALCLCTCASECVLFYFCERERARARGVCVCARAISHVLPTFGTNNLIPSDPFNLSLSLFHSL